MSSHAVKDGAGQGRRSGRPSLAARLFRAVWGGEDYRTRGILPELLEARQMLAADVVISEIMHHPEPYDLGAEYIELYNRGDMPADLLNWRFSKGVDLVFSSDKLGTLRTLGAGQYLAVAADVGVFQAKYPAVGNVIGGWTGRLSNSREELELQDAAGVTMDNVVYADQGDWAVRERGAYGWVLPDSVTYNSATAKVNVYEPAHGYSTGNTVDIAGANQAGYNGRYSITVIDTNNFQYTPTGSPAQQPSGVIVTRKRSSDHSHHGWTWVQLADGAGRSLELINPTVSNNSGQNWSSSTVVHGTPGGSNSVASGNIAPLILDAAQTPIVPTSTEAVTITARIVDELPTGAAASLHWRLDGAASFVIAPMFDDGLHGDQLANDGLWGATIPPQANNTVVEFYLTASDAGGNTRAWPAPALDRDGVSWMQSANLLYQVDDLVYSGTQPMFKLIMTEAERAEIVDIGDTNGDSIAEEDSDAQMNATFITVDPSGAEIRYISSVRNRGAGSRNQLPNNYRVNINTDNIWNNVTALNLNGRYSMEEVAGSAVLRQAGLVAQNALPVQVRVNNANLAANDTTHDMFTSYSYMEAENTEFIDNHYAADSSGNYYRVVSGNHTASLDYRGTNPDSYRNEYFKHSNYEDDDWSDLIALARAFNTTQTPDAVFPATLSSVIDINQWLRYFAVTTLMGDRETTLGTGSGDDYSLYRGASDTRFQIIAHDLDTVLGRGDTAAIPTQSIFEATAVASVSRFLKHPQFAPLYFAQIKDLLDTVFSPPQFNALLDNLISFYVPSSALAVMKQFVVDRITSVLTQMPLTLSGSSADTPLNNYPRTTAATTALSGRANAIRTRSVLVNGTAATWSAWQAQWSAPAVPLRNGLNRILVQSLDESGVEFERMYIDVWRDTAMTSVSGTLPAGTTTWTVASSPYRVTANLTVPAGATLTIQPGATVFFDAGFGMTVNGQLLAQGTALQRIRFTRTPSATANWRGINFVYSSYSALVNRISYADFEYSDAAGYAIKTDDAQIHLDNLRFANHNAQFLTFDNSSIIVTNSYFPNVTSVELIHYSGFPATGYARFEGNWFGSTTGYNDIIDFTGGQRPGPIAQFLNNVFNGGSDDALDLDGTDAHIEGNVFMHFHQDGARESKSHAVSTGTENGNTSDVTIVRNLFYDLDHAIIIKDGSFGTIVNNTIVNIYKKIADATTAAINTYEPRSGQWQGSGIYLDGNIFHNVSKMFENSDWAGHPLSIIMNRSIFPGTTGEPVTWTGVGNSNADPLLLNTANVTDPRMDFRLRPGSPGLGTGPNGRDMGGAVSAGASISGVPVFPTRQTSATLQVGGPDVFSYKYRVNGGSWSAEVAQPIKSVSSLVRNGVTVTATVTGHGLTNNSMVTISGASPADYNGNYIIRNVTANTFDYLFGASAPMPTSPASGSISVVAINTALPPVSLTGLTNGSYTVEAIAKNSAGQWQLDTQPTVSKTWTVNTALGGAVRINEVLAWNVAAVNHSGTYPDIIELYNPGGADIDLSGMSVSDNPAAPLKYVFPAGTLLPTGQYLVLYADNPSAAPGLHLGFSLKADGEGVYLYDKPASGGALIDSVAFGYQMEDYSIARRSDGSWSLARSTFGSANILVPTSDGAKLKINEWLTSGVDPFPNDFVELYNPDPVPVDMGGFSLSDVPESWPDKHAIAPLTFIPAGGYFVFTADGDTAQGADHLNFKLSMEQGALGLFDPSRHRIDGIMYGSQRPAVSQGRTPDGDLKFVFFAQPSPAVANPGGTGSVVVPLDLIVDTPTQGWNWRFNQSATDLLTAWRGYDYIDTITGWEQGPGAFGYDSDFATGTFRTPLNRGGSTTRTPTFYFRTHFTLDVEPSTLTALQLQTFLDDGAIFYINGTQVFDVGMPTNVANITYSTYTNASPNNGRNVGNAVWEGPTNILTKALPALRKGDNVLAVEVHQANATSSDIVFNASLRGEITVVAGDAPPLRVTEINYNPPAAGGLSSDDYEYLELTNAGASPINLNGFRFGAGITFTFPNVNIDPGQHLVVAKNPVAFKQRYGDTIPVVGPYNDVLSNAGEQIRILDNIGAIVQDFSYSDAWYPSTDGGGYSLNIIDINADPSEWRNPANWRPSRYQLGSPGIDDPASAAETVVINEVLSHSHAAAPDWIELLNSTASPIDVGGWYLSDDSADLRKYRIPDNSVIDNGKYLVLNQTDHFGSAFALSEIGEDLYLSAADVSGKLTGYRQMVRIGGAETAISFGRYTDSTGQVQFVPLSQETPDGPNAYPKVGPIVISEIMYHPAGTDPEFIELQNISAAPVPLFDPERPDNTWRFTDGIDFVFPKDITVPPGGFVLIVNGDPAAFRAARGIPSQVPVLGPFENVSNLSNGGERLTLVKPISPDPDGAIPWVAADSIKYGTAAPWPIAPDGSGPSLSRISLTTFANDPINWQAGPDGGTPGPQGPSNSLVGTPAADVFYLRLSANGTTLEVFSSNPPGGNLIYSMPIDSLTPLSITALGGDDTLVVDLSNGNPIPAAGIIFDGGDQTDQIKIIGTKAADTLAANDTQVLFGLRAITYSNAETVTLDNTGDIVLGSLSLSGSARVNLPAANRTLRLASLSLNDNGTLDLADNDLLLANGTTAQVQAWVATARNNGTWDGTGLTTSAATSNTTLGVVPQAGGGILVKYTWYGDVNGDGAINLNDYFIVDSNYLAQIPGVPLSYAQGDVNFDGAINLNDYFLIDSAYLGQSGTLAAPQFSTARVRPSPTRAARKRPMKRKQRRGK